MKNRVMRSYLFVFGLLLLVFSFAIVSASAAPSSSIQAGQVSNVSNTSAALLCSGERFTDVCPGDYFYEYVLRLNDHAAISGYNSAPPCESGAQVPCFKPSDLITRGQAAKIISTAAGFSWTIYNQSFEDVPPGSTFYDYVGRLVGRGVVTGYPCGGLGEPCIEPYNRPYFRITANVNRAQLAKFTAIAFRWEDPAPNQTFEDVVPDNHFFPFIENLAHRNAINGYSCGGPGEPCGTENRPYFRYGNLITRGQTAKLVGVARFVVPTPVPTGPALIAVSTAAVKP